MVSPAVRRLGLIVLGLAVGLLLVLGFMRSSRKHQAAHPEILLRDGTVLQIEGLTWGTNQFLRLEPVWWSKVKRRLPAAWQSRIGAPDPVRQLGGDRDSHLWFSRYDANIGGYLAPINFELSALDSAGHAFPSSGGSGFGSGRAVHAASLNVVDWRSDTLRFRLEENGTVKEFTVTNPRRGEPFPEWKPESLPQKRSAGGFEFTLRALQPWSETAKREWRPMIGVNRDGQDATAWLNLQPMFVDPTGNRHWTTLPAGEPVWGLELVAYPSARYPFPDGHAFPVGRVRIPAAGKYEFLPAELAATNAGLHLAWITGPGSFRFRDGQNLTANPVSQGSSGGSTSLGDSWNVSHDSDKSRLFLLLRGPAGGARLVPAATNPTARLLPRLRRADGTFWEGTGRGYSSTDDGRQRAMLVDFDLAGAQAGEEMDLDLFLVEPLQVNFTFAAPAAK